MNTPDTPATEPSESAAPPVPLALKRFLWDIQSMVELTDNEREILLIGRDLMSRLVAGDDWLPAVFATPDPARHQQFQLYADVQERFSVAVTILADGQALPAVYAPVWELLGVVRGAVGLTHFPMAESGPHAQGSEARILQRGSVAAFASGSRDALRLGNMQEGGLSIVLHVYGGEMAKIDRQAFLPDGTVLAGPFAYANGPDAPPYDIFSIQTRIED